MECQGTPGFHLKRFKPEKDDPIWLQGIWWSYMDHPPSRLKGKLIWQMFVKIWWYFRDFCPASKVYKNDSTIKHKIVKHTNCCCWVLFGIISNSWISSHKVSNSWWLNSGKPPEWCLRLNMEKISKNGYKLRPLTSYTAKIRSSVGKLHGPSRQTPQWPQAWQQVMGETWSDHIMMERDSSSEYQGTMGCTPNSVPMVFIVFSRDSWR